MSIHQISTDQANTMIQSYLDSAGTTDLHSLIFDADELRDYLATNNSSIKIIKVMFAHTAQFAQQHQGENAGYRQGAFTLIIVGYDASGNYVYWDSDNVMDNAIECPNNCPTSGTASSNLLT